MKVLYTSVYRDGTGYGGAAIEDILALEHAGLEVVCRPITMTGPKAWVESDVVGHLERKDLQGVDVVIQHCLPHTFERKGGVKNIGMFSWETTHFRRSSWVHHCNAMDEIWVSCLQNRQASLDSGVKVPIRVVPRPARLSRLSAPLSPLNIPAAKGKMVFYTIGEYSRRKNFVGLLRAYYAAFSSRTDVVLVIKTSMPGMKPEQAEQQLAKMIADLKASMHVYPNQDHYPPVVLITRHLSAEQLDQLHAAGDVFLLPSHGEAWCLPAMDAMSMGRPLMVSNWGAFPDLVTGDAHRHFHPESQTFASIESRHAWLIPGQLMPCFAPDSPFPDLYTGDERWFEPSLDALVEAMRNAYGAWEAGCLADRGRLAKLRSREFGHDRIGRIMREALEG